MRYLTKTQLQSSNPHLLLRAKTTAGELDKAIAFKRFDNKLNMHYDEDASKNLKKDYWRVLDSFKFYYDTEGSEDKKWAIVPAGFLTDGASVPRWFWGLVAPWGNYGQAAALHDYLIEYGVVFHNNQRVNISRKEADHVFNEAMRVAGVSKWQRRIMFLSVRAYSKIGLRSSIRRQFNKRRLEADWIKENYQV